MITRLGVIGDVHAEHDRLEKAISFLCDQTVDAIVCTGDIVDGSGCPDASADLLLQHEVHTVRGNHDRWILENRVRHVPDAHLADDLHKDTLSFLDALPSTIEIDTVAGRLMLCHGVADNDLCKVWPGTERMPAERSVELDQLIESGRYRFVINGHMHFRTMVHFETLTLINAGTLKGEHWPGFCLIDFGTGEISSFEFTEPGIRCKEGQPLSSDHYETFSDTRDFRGNWNPVRLF